MPDTGNTTSPADPADRLPPTPSATHAVALVLCQCLPEPHREGEVALVDPRGRRPLVVGRQGDPFFQQRPGEMIDRGRLRGDKISGEQLIVTAEGDGARVHNVGRAPIFVDGTRLPKNTSVLVMPGAVIEVFGHSVLLVTRRPLAIPAPHRLLLPLQPFGELDSMGFGGESPQAWEQREAVVVAANAGRNVLVFGETGTGKELVARAIHARSARARAPYLAVNSPNLTSEIAALSLFGGRANWPNPGTPETIGYFAAAEGGTLLLDELGEISAAVQANLLRALESGYCRMGETVTRPTRCIVVIATNRGEAGVKEDVRMRCGVTIVSPSLSERREDIAQIARHLLLARAKKDPDFARSFVKADTGGRPYVEMDASLMNGLLRGPIRGNVRELDIILGMSIDAARGEPPLRWPARLSPPQPAHLEIRKEPEYASIKALLEGLSRRNEDVEREPCDDGAAPDPSPELVLETLRATHWNYTEAAAMLGITRDKLYRLRTKYGIVRPR
jgi:DNA-binding NtrC family response regulator